MKKAVTTSLWRTGAQIQTKEEILQEAERMREIDRSSAQGTHANFNNLTSKSRLFCQRMIEASTCLASRLFYES